MRTHVYSLATALATAAAVAVLGGAAGAAPAAQSADPAISYTANVIDGAVVLKTASGSLAAAGNRLEIRDATGRLAAGVPLSYRRDGKVWAIDADVHNNVAVLRPNTAQPVDAAGVDGTAVFNNALGIATTEISLAVTVGSLLGTIIGAPVGCIAGVVVGAVLVPPLFLPGAAGGCIAGLVAGIALGSATGTVLLGAPVTIAAAIQFFNNLAAPDPKH